MSRRASTNSVQEKKHATSIAVRRSRDIASRGRQRNDEPSDELLTVAEVLTALHVSRSTWYHWRQTGKAPNAIKLPNGGLRVRRSALTKWLQELEEPAP